MKSLIYPFILFFLLFGTCYTIVAKDPYFKHYNNKQGLSHNTVYCSLQDRLGFMWFGTEDGLNRFDGHTFKVYRYNSYLPTSLPNDRVFNLFEDSEGKIWVCTDYGTCYYDYKTDAFYPLKFTPENNNPEFFSNVEEDKYNNLWFRTYNRIVKYSPSNKNISVYPGNKYFHSLCMTMTEEGNPLFANAANLYLYRPETDHFNSIQIITQEERRREIEISSICQIPETGVLAGTNKAGVKLYLYGSRTVETIIPNIQVRAITAFSKNVYWIASESGIYIYNVLDKTVTHLQKSLTDEYTIADNAVYSITKDREGGMWVGAFFGGISYLPNEYARFNHFIGGKSHPGMLGNAVREICPDTYGNLWLGTEDNGINCYNLKTGTMTNFSLNNASRPLSATNIHGLLADGNKLWIGTFNKGIDILDIPSGKVIKRYTMENTNRALKSDFVLCFHKTKDNKFLIGTSNGTVIYDARTDSFHPWKDIHFLVRQIYDDSLGNIWIVTSGGLYRYLAEEDKLSYYRSDPHKSQSLGSNNVTSVFEDSQQRIWVTTMNGFSLYNEQTDSFNRITTENGLPSNIIFRILEDDNHNFWISTANGLVKFNPSTYVMRTYSYTDGLHEAQFNFSSSYKAPGGTMYMGTINGMISFNPENFKEDTFCPPLYITRISLPDDKKDTPLPASIEKTDTLQLPYNASTFTLAYVALSYTSPEAIQYAYILEGTDNDWVSMKQNKEVTFANLSPGKYIFKVKSTNSSGIWQNNEKELYIVITPPFWATGWAMLIYILILCVLIMLFYNYKKSKLEEKHRISQDIFEAQKEKELYNAKIQFFTFITHEIRTPLTLIKAPLEKIIQSNDGTPATKENLRIIGKNTQRLLNLSNQLLDFRKTESKGFRLNFVQTDITLWVTTMLQRFKPAMETENKLFSLDLPKEHFTGYVDREAFSKIISNLLTNAIKYSKQKITLQLSLLPDENKFVVLVSNDGFLIPESEKEKIFKPFYRLKETENMQGSGMGLSLARSLAEFHNGTLLYRHADDTMNQFVLTLPIKQENGYEVSPEDNQPLTPGNSKEPENTPEAESREEETISFASATGKPTVLIVEDQKDMREFIAKELSETYTVLEADNGQTALAILNKRNNVNLIISDVMMPVMDGFEFCNKVKNDLNFSHIPFIILTAQHNLQSRLEGLNRGADAYIEKPFSIELLQAQITNLFKSREVLNRTYLEKPLTPAATLAVSKVDDIFLDKFNLFLNENLTNEALNVEMLASALGMSTSSLYRKVKGISGLSPVDFIRIFRLKKAVQLMQTGETRINEIAFQVGFSSPAYFSTCFQKQYGKTPSEFMKEISKNL